MFELYLIQESDKKLWKEFIDAPYRFYQDLPHWVAPVRMSVVDLLKKSHPVWENCQRQAMVVKKNNIVVGRIMAINNQAHADFHQLNVDQKNQKESHFGFFDLELSLSFDEMLTVANLLFTEVKRFARSWQALTLVGPFNPSTNYECGILLSGYDDPPQIMMTYHPPIIQQVLENSGLVKIKTLYAYRFNVHDSLPEKIKQIASYTEQKEGLSYRCLDMSRWDDEIQSLYKLYNASWANNWGFVPMSKDEFQAMAKELKMVVRPEFILFAQCRGEDVGFLIALPDFNRIFQHHKKGKLSLSLIWDLLTKKKSIDRVRIITMGLMPEFRSKGLASLMYVKIQEIILSSPQYVEAELSWILEDNTDMNRPLQLMQAEVYKTYGLYQFNSLS